MAQDILMIENEGAVRTLRLNRSDVLNSFNNDLLAALNKAVREAEKDAAVRCLIITGEGRGFSAGQDLADVADRYKGEKLLRQVIEPSSEIPEKFLNQRLELADDRLVTGVVVKEVSGEYHVLTNLLTPSSVTRIPVKDVVRKVPSKVSPMPTGLLNVLTREEVLDLLGFLEVGYKMPPHPKDKPPEPKP